MSPVTDTPSWRDTAVSYIRSEAQPPDKFGHQPRLYSLAVRIGTGLPYDDDVLFAAAWLHDIGVFLGHRPSEPSDLATWDNVDYACRKAPDLLEQFAFPDEKIQQVVDAIRTHLPDRDPKTPEGILLRDADILEQLGATGILRNVCKVGSDTRYATHADIIPVLRRNLETLPGMLRLPVSREIAEERISLLRAFLDGVTAEAEESFW
jgi:uncharacterized protein